MEVDVAADHHGRELLHGGVLCLHGADVLALAQHGAAVGHLHDLRKLVGDEQDALALRGEVLHDLHELRDLLRRQHRGGLVEDQDLIVAVEHLENLGTLLHTDGDILDFRVGINTEAVFFGEGQDLLAGFLLLKKSHLVWLYAQNDVIENREALDQLEVLMDHPDAEVVGVIRVVDFDFFSVLLDDTLLGLVQAEQNTHQRALAGAVLSQKRVDFAFFQLEGNVIVGDDAGESLRDVKHLNRILLQIHSLLFTKSLSSIAKVARRPGLLQLKNQALLRRAVRDHVSTKTGLCPLRWNEFPL